MKASGPRDERETVIIWNEADDSASIWTASDPVYRGLMKRLGTEYLIEDGERHAVFAFPRKWLNLPRVRAKRALTPAQRSHLEQIRSQTPREIGSADQETPTPEGSTDG